MVDVVSWQPIKTAPKDGTAVWVWHGGAPYIGYFEPAVAEWDTLPGQWFLHAGFRRKGARQRHDEIFGTNVYDASPSLWMTLPYHPVNP
jgi:hypothetical protein